MKGLPHKKDYIQGLEIIDLKQTQNAIEIVNKALNSDAFKIWLNNHPAESESLESVTKMVYEITTTIKSITNQIKNKSHPPTEVEAHENVSPSGLKQMIITALQEFDYTTDQLRRVNEIINE